MERRAKLENGKVRVDFLNDVEKRKLKKFFKDEARIYSSSRGIFIKPAKQRTAESIALDVGEELMVPVDVPSGTNLENCFAPQNWPSVPAATRF